MTPDPWCVAARHGHTYSAYVAGCRCTPARAANAAYRRERRVDTHLLIDSTGSRRRMQALMAAGWPIRALAAELYVSSAVAHRWATLDRRIHRRNAARITALYDRLSATEGGSAWSTGTARRHGWPPPSWWGPDIDDPTAAPRGPWTPPPLLDRLPYAARFDRDTLDDAADRALDEALDAIEAADAEWFEQQRRASRAWDYEGVAA